jgi:hypothetical protein
MRQTTNKTTTKKVVPIALFNDRRILHHPDCSISHAYGGAKPFTIGYKAAEVGREVYAVENEL